MRACLAGVLAAVWGMLAGVAASAVPPKPTHFVAHRYDDTRVVFSLEKTFPDEPELRRGSLAQNPTRMPDPAAKLAGMTLWKMDESFWKRHARDLPGPVPGDRWVIEAGGVSSYHCTIENLAIAEVACGTAIVAIGQVNPAEQEAFRHVNEKHYLAVSEANHVAVPPSGTGSALLGEPPSRRSWRRRCRSNSSASCPESAGLLPRATP
jgi:hypothetical protein